jgi:LuxR family maltose regulon positive regulatory protein
MSAPLLTTKLFPPPPGKLLVDRPCLISKLNACLDPGCRLALISAPAGFGKTTLVSAWAVGVKHPERPPSPSVAWVSLDDRDNDPILFWSYIISSLQSEREGLGKHFLSLLRAAIPPDLEGGLDLFINELAGIPNPLCLILDDYHHIRNPAVHQSIAFLLEHAPSQFHVILASRIDPPLPLALLRGRGQLVEIRLNDLRFSTQDADNFLNSGMGLDLPIQAVEALNQKTEGWISGLKMAALSLQEAASLQDRKRMEDFISSFSGTNRFILDYLIEEVLSQQPAEIQDFLLKTSILDRLCGPLCDALLWDKDGGVHPGSEKALEYLDSSNLFIVPLDDQRYWYRYHQLFADLLRKRLNQMDPNLVIELHQRAIQWCEQNGLITKAVEYAFNIKDYQKAAFLINQIVEEMWGRGEHTTLLNWIKALPEEEKRKYPHLWIWQVSMLITAGEMQEAERRVCEIEDYLCSLPADLDQASFMGQVYSLRAYIASFYKDVPNLLNYARLALDNLTRPEDGGSRCGILLVMSNAYLNKGDLNAAAQALTEAIDAGKIAKRSYMVLAAMENLAIVLYTQGDLKLANQACQEGLLLVEQNGLDHSPMAANLFIGQGLILCERHELDEAENYIHRGLDLACERNYIWSSAWGYRALLRLLLARNNLLAAETAIREADQLAGLHEIPEYHTCGISGLKVRAWIRMGKIEQAEGYLQARRIQVNGDIQYPHETEYWALASLCLVKREMESGVGLLERLLHRAESGKQQLWVIRCLALQALFYQALGNQGQSLQCLSRALNLAAPEGYIQTFVDEGEPMLHLLQEAFRQKIHSEYVRLLLKAFKDETLEGNYSQGLPVQTGNSMLIKPLNKREMEIIRLIADGCSNKEIAQKLYISVRTVKYYTTSIYTKLEVNGRAQAAVKAKDLGILK